MYFSPNTCLSPLSPSPFTPAAPGPALLAVSRGILAQRSAADLRAFWGAGGICLHGDGGSPCAAVNQREDGPDAGSQGQDWRRGLHSSRFWSQVYLSDPDPVHLERRKVSVIDSEWNRSMSSLKDAVSKGLNPEVLQEVFGREFDSAVQSLMSLPVPPPAAVYSSRLHTVGCFLRSRRCWMMTGWSSVYREAKSPELKQLLTNHNAVPTPARTGDIHQQLWQ